MTEVILVQSFSIPEKILQNSRSLIATYFPDKKILINDSDCAYDYKLIIEEKSSEEELLIFTWEKDNILIKTYCISKEYKTGLQKFPIVGKENLSQIIVKQGIVTLLSLITGQILPWGILIGTRPSKLMFRMNQMKIESQVQSDILKKMYLAKKDKIELLQSVEKHQKSYITNMLKNIRKISIYISIPFCPSRCSYCTFPSNLPGKTRKKVVKYLEVLKKEIKLVSQMMLKMNIQAENIYFGGGTPTSLLDEEIESLLLYVKNLIPTSDDLELDFEAGRADTITESKLKILQKYGVNRISINPQTMHDSTLKKIGRQHSVAEVIECFKMARLLSNWTINMDLILGLQGEGSLEIHESVDKLLALKPDNITIHALALKRGSTDWQRGCSYDSNALLYGIGNSIHSKIISEGYYPYYMYRQKHIAGNLENTGYCLPGKECRYNIGIIEEKQSIIGIGAGSATKVFNYKELSHINMYNPIDLDVYFEKLENINLLREERFRQVIETFGDF
ncbi:MAG: coproporphyrinogen dehydrogenase HemZ [Eubacteriales bacterium]